jgi:hypothetical protein
MTNMIQQFCVKQFLGFTLFSNCSEHFIVASVLFLKLRGQGVGLNPPETIMNVNERDDYCIRFASHDYNGCLSPDTFNLPYVHDYITKLCRKQAEVIQNHENIHVLSTGQVLAGQRKCKRLKLGGGQAYDCSSD